MYPCPRTKRIDDARFKLHASKFKVLANEVHRLLEMGGLIRRDHKGSVSWLTDKETDFKLCFYGSEKFAFGVRRDFVKNHAPDLESLDWPHRFGVPPSTDVEFVGFYVSNDDRSIDRIDRILQSLGVLKDSAEIAPRDYETRERRFDEQLKSLDEHNAET